MVASVAAVTVLTACGGASEQETRGLYPGGITSTQAGFRANDLLLSNGCDAPQSYSSVEAEAEGEVWKLRATIGQVPYSWTFDPVANTIVENAGRCTGS